MSTKPIMYAVITPKNTYDIEVNGKLYNNCKLVSKWEGFAKFETKTKDSIIVDWYEGGAIEILFNAEKSRKCAIIKASPDVLAGE